MDFQPHHALPRRSRVGGVGHRLWVTMEIRVVVGLMATLPTETTTDGE